MSQSLLEYNIKYDQELGFDNEIYTDGSKQGTKVGCAFVLYDNGIEITHYKYRLGDNDSIFMAELLAIFKAVEYIVENCKNKYFSIISDSKSVLECLCAIEEDKELIVNLRNKIILLNIRLYWTRSHIGTVGNERADVFAKEACLKGNIDYAFEPTKRDIKKNLDSLYLQSKNGSRFRTIRKTEDGV